jgi:hypothetical protein
LLVIILTLVTSLLARRNEGVQMMQEKQIDNSRTTLIIEITEFLFDKQKITHTTINQSIGKTIQDLKNASAVLDNSTVRVEKLLKDVSKIEAKRNS